MTNNPAIDLEHGVLPVSAKSDITISTSIKRSALSIHLTRIRLVMRAAAIKETDLKPSPSLPLA